MGGIAAKDCELCLPVLQYSGLAGAFPGTLPGKNATINLLPIFAILGWGTIRIYAETDVGDMTLNVFQKESALVSGVVGTFRRTNSWAIPAGGSPGPTLSKSALVTGDYGRIQIVTVTAPARLIVRATLYPGSFSLT